MYVTFPSLVRLENTDPKPFHYVVIQTGGKFFNASLNSISEMMLGNLPVRVAKLEKNPAPSVWPTKRYILIDGAMEGLGEWDGSDDLHLTVELKDQAIDASRIRGLGQQLLGFRQLIDGKLGNRATAVAAQKLQTAQTFQLSGLIETNPLKFDGSDNVILQTRLSKSLSQRFDNTFKGAVARNVDADSYAINGVYYGTEMSNTPQASGALWNLMADDGKSGVQQFQGFNTGRMWHRTYLDGQFSNWAEVWTEVSFRPDRKAELRDSFAIATVIGDYDQPQTSSIARWRPDTPNAPADSGTTLEINSTGNKHETIERNWVNRLGFANDGRIFHHRNINGEGWQIQQVWTDSNFDPKVKVDAATPLLRGTTQVLTGTEGTEQSLLQLGWDSGMRWNWTLNEDASLGLWAYDSERARKHNLIRFSSLIAGGASLFQVNASRMIVGVNRGTARYGTTIDDWSNFSTTSVMGWAQGDTGVTYVNKTTKVFYHQGALSIKGRVEATRLYANWDAGQEGGISCDNWFRSAGPTGWANSTYGGGWYMTDFRHIRALNDKRVLAGGFSVASSNVNREQAEPLSYRGQLRPIVFFNKLEQAKDFGFDLDQLRSLYPEAVEDQKDYTAISINAIAAIMVAHTNNLEDELAKANSKNLRLEADLNDMRDAVTQLQEQMQQLLNRQE